MAIEHEVMLLKIRNLIADKAMVTAQAQHDLARFNEWRCDYVAWIGGLNIEIEALFKKLDELPPF